jgi:serine/threonine protein kinase
MVAERTSPPFLDQLRASALLDGAQLAELSGCPEARDPAPTPLARVVFQRGWLTRFQLNTIAAGRGKDLIVGPYVVLDRLGEGGMGMVYKARHQHMQRVVALKVIRKERLASADSVRRFYQEVQMAAALSHPNIVLAYDAGQAGNTHYFAMEYVEGVDLSRLVKDQGRLPVPQACDYIRQAALGLLHAHEKGMVHRDIKPANLLVSRAPVPAATDIATGRSAGMGPRGDVVKILDMGLARLQGAGDTGMTKTGAVMGTPDYLAPEQAMNSRAADIRADLYSLGCTFYFLLTAKPPFVGVELTEVLLKHQMEKPASLAKRGVEAPPGVQDVLDRLLAKDPDDRYQTPAGLVADLSPFCREGKLADEVLNSLVEGESSDDDEPDGLALRDRPRAKSGRRRDAEEMQTSELSRTSAGARQIRRKRRAAREEAQRRKQLLLVGGIVGGAVLVVGLLAGGLYLALGRSRTADHAQGPAPAEQPARGAPDAPGGQQPNPGGNPVVPPPGADPVKPAPGGDTAKPPPGGGGPVKPGGEPVQPPQGGGDPPPAGDLGPAETPGGRRVKANLPRFEFAVIEDRVFVTFATPRQLRVSVKGADDRVGFEVPGTETNCFALSPDGKKLLTAHSDHSLRLWDVASGKELHKLTGHTQTVATVAFSPNGRLALSGGGSRPRLGPAEGIDRALRVWEVDSGKLVRTLKPTLDTPTEGMEANFVVFGADSQLAVSIHGHHMARVWDVERGQELLKAEKWKPQTPECAALSPDGTVLLLGCRDGVFLLHAKTGAEWHRLQGLLGWAQAVAFAPDSRNVLAGGGEGRIGPSPEDCAVRVWDVATGRQVRTFMGHRKQVRQIVFVNEHIAYSSSQDGTIWRWDLRAPGVGAADGKR